MVTSGCVAYKYVVPVPQRLKRREGSPEHAQSAPPDTRIGTSILKVTDLDRRRTLLYEALGMERKDVWVDQRRFSRTRYHHHLALNTWHSKLTDSTGR